MVRTDSGKQLKATVRQIYREYVDAGGEFHLEQVREKALQLTEDLAESLHEEALDAALHGVDEEEARGSEVEAPQQAFPGFRLDRVYRLGEGRRQPERFALITHEQEHLAIQRKHADEAKASADRELDEYLKLAPYWTPGRTKSEAVNAYLDSTEAAS